MREKGFERQYERRGQLAGMSGTTLDKNPVNALDEGPRPGLLPLNVELAMEWANLGGD